MEGFAELQVRLLYDFQGAGQREVGIRQRPKPETVGERWVATDGTKGWKINAVKLLYDDDGTFGVKVPLHGRPRNGDFKKLQARLHQGLLDAANRDNR